MISYIPIGMMKWEMVRVRRRIKLELGGREFSFVTDEPEEKVMKILEYVREEYENYRSYEDRVSFEEIMLLILLNTSSKLFNLEEELQELREKYDRLIETFNREAEGKTGTA